MEKQVPPPRWPPVFNMASKASARLGNVALLQSPYLDDYWSTYFQDLQLCYQNAPSNLGSIEAFPASAENRDCYGFPMCSRQQHGSWMPMTSSPFWSLPSVDDCSPFSGMPAGKKRPLKCIKCPYITDDMQILMNHVDIHFPVKTFICIHCYASFVGEFELVLHYQANQCPYMPR